DGRRGRRGGSGCSRWSRVWNHKYNQQKGDKHACIHLWQRIASHRPPPTFALNLAKSAQRAFASSGLSSCEDSVTLFPLPLVQGVSILSAGGFQNETV